MAAESTSREPLFFEIYRQVPDWEKIFFGEHPVELPGLFDGLFWFVSVAYDDAHLSRVLQHVRKSGYEPVIVAVDVAGKWKYSQPTTGQQMTKPFSPKEAQAAAGASIPDFVIEAFNELLAEGGGVNVRINVDDAIERIKIKSTATFDNKWLNVEPIYRRSGWKVRYDKPGYNESYMPFFEFEAEK